MEKVLFSLIFLTSISYGQEITTITEKDSKTLAVTKYDYECEKGEKKILYRMMYKDVDGEPPCRIYEVIDKRHRKKIAESLRTPYVCEEAMTRIVKKLESEGMLCTKSK
jgi:hypothetical protein